MLSLLLACGGAVAMPAAEAAAAPAVSLRFLMIIKPVSQVPGLTATLSQAQIDAARTAFLSTFPRMVEDLTGGTVDMNTQVVVSPRPLTSIGYQGLMVEPGNVPDDVAQYVHPQEWDGVFVTGQMIVGAGSNRCVDVSGGRDADGTKVQLWDCHGGPEVRWRWQGGTLVNSRTGKCLDVAGGRTAAGTKVQLWTCLNNGAQRWQLAGELLRNPQSGTCLDADAWGTANGTQLIIWDCGAGQSNQTWRFQQ
ncbi:RICIN domain-containing protein [Dactylosporangium sp. NPDC050588]|uniref:RICIN domain-containing protein n=1 Tax=Dactylosporangium sp. NPDC050588 TaxID=3157211 RepID=UPI00340FD3E7